VWEHFRRRDEMLPGRAGVCRGGLHPSTQMHNKGAYATPFGTTQAGCVRACVCEGEIPAHCGVERGTNSRTQ